MAVEERTARWERLAPLGAIGFLGTIVLGAAVVGETTPSGQASAQEIAGYFAEHQGAVFFNSTMVVIGAFVFFPLFLAAVWRAIHRTDGEVDGGMWAVVAMVAGVVLLGPLLIQAVGWGAAALHAGEHRDPWVAAALMDLGDMGFLLLPIPVGLFVAATSQAASGGLFPRWLIRIGRVLAPVCIVGTVLAAGLAPVYFTLFGLWLVAVATTLLRTGGHPQLVGR